MSERHNFTLSHQNANGEVTSITFHADSRESLEENLGHARRILQEKTYPRDYVAEFERELAAIQ